MSKWTRSIGVTAVAGLIAGAIVSATPAQAGKRCGKFRPGTPVTDSQNAADAKKAPVRKVTDRFTAKKPLKIKYTHGPAAWFITDPVDADGQRAAVEDTKWFNIQVDSKKKKVGLYIRQEWTPVPVSDMDLYLYDRNGAPAGQSADWNQVQDTPLNTGTGGPGYEQISGLYTRDCTGYTIESRAFTTPSDNMTLKIWLGPVK